MALSDSELWKRLKGLEGETVYTITYKKPNRIIEVTNKRVEISGKMPVSFEGKNGIFEKYRTLIRDGYLVGPSGAVGMMKVNLRRRRVIMAILQRAVPEEIECIPPNEGNAGIRLRER